MVGDAYYLEGCTPYIDDMALITSSVSAGDQAKRQLAELAKLNIKLAHSSGQSSYILSSEARFLGLKPPGHVGVETPGLTAGESLLPRN